MRPDVHAGGVPPYEEWLAVLDGLVHERERPGGDLLVDRFHPLFRKRTGIFDLSSGEGVDHTAGTELLLEFGILGVVNVLRLFFGIQVIEIAEEFVEAVRARKKLIAIT